MITGAQIRAARALLGWTGAQLADRSGVSTSSIQRAEATRDVPSMRADNLLKIQQSLEAAGVMFVEIGDTRPGGAGVRLRLR
jgi:transcriptional regulator with XRE-family HTH domain